LHHFAIASQSLCDRFAIALRPASFNRTAPAAEALRNGFEIADAPRNGFELTLTLRNRFEITANVIVRRLLPVALALFCSASCEAAHEKNAQRHRQFLTV
jgi:hypothetical protein